MTDPRQNDKTVVAFPRRNEPASQTMGSGPRTFEEALAAELDSLYAAATRLARDPASAEDLVQEVALKAYRSFQDLRSHDQFRPWLFTILHNTAKNWNRDASRRTPHADVELDALLEDPLLAEPLLQSPEEILIRESLSGDLEAGFRSLPGPFLQVLWLVDVEEFTISEAAGILGIPVGTAASRLHRAHRALRDHLENASGGPPGGKGVKP